MTTMMTMKDNGKLATAAMEIGLLPFQGCGDGWGRGCRSLVAAATVPTHRKRLGCSPALLRDQVLGETGGRLTS